MSDKRCPYCTKIQKVHDQKFVFHGHRGYPGLPLCFGSAMHIPTLEALGEM